MERIEGWEDSLEKFCEDNKFTGYFFASAKSGANVDQAVHSLVEQVSKYTLLKLT